MAKVILLDRVDQVEWYTDSSWINFDMAIDRHREIREWLEEYCSGVVVISGDGRIPPAGGVDHPTRSIYEKIRANMYRFYFELENDAILFKLTWCGQ